MRRRSNDQGSVYKNEARGRWEAKYFTVGADGSRVRKLITARTRREVEAKLRDALDAREQGMPPPDTMTTFATFAAWWADHALPAEGLAPSTERWYREILGYYVLPHVGQRTLAGQRALRPADVETMTGALMNEHSHRTAVAARTVVGKVLRAAEQRGLVGRNVAYLAKRPRDRGKVRAVKAFTVDQVATLLGALDGTPWHPIVVVGVTTGLRPGELLALHWPDVHLADPEPHVSVRHAFTYVDGPALKAPKRERSHRTVPLAPEAVAVLKSWRKEQAAQRLAAGPFWSPDWPGLVFTREDGTPRRVDVFRQALADATPGAHPHRLRHSYATHLLEAGTPIHHVAELLGDSVATVEASYSHVLRRKHEVVSVVSGLVSRG